MLSPHPETWLYPTENGLYCEPGQFHIDPHRPVERAVITHGHGDHARSGHGAVLATAETIAIMKVRYGPDSAERFEETTGPLTVNGVSVRLVPAGHILGSAQIVLEWQGVRAVVSGDYKRRHDPTCRPYELVTCDLFITEATFGLPVFKHEPADREARRLVNSMRDNPERTHLLGVYNLGKCQRMIVLVRQAGFDGTIYLHGGLKSLCDLYERLGVPLGDLKYVMEAKPAELKGALVLCPPSAISDRWSRRLADPLTAFASGWMRVRGRARQRGVELPLVVSDHCDWPELLQTIEETQAEEIWVTHGREDALTHQITKMGKRGRALALVGFEDEGD
ncbi:ligase-associated DNA damage response exonuclease [soil metagenome]